jgi:hypothetical protein
MSTTTSVVDRICRVIISSALLISILHSAFQIYSLPAAANPLRPPPNLRSRRRESTPAAEATAANAEWADATVPSAPPAAAPAGAKPAPSRPANHAEKDEDNEERQMRFPPELMFERAVASAGLPEA